VAADVDRHVAYDLDALGVGIGLGGVRASKTRESRVSLQSVRFGSVICPDRKGLTYPDVLPLAVKQELHCDKLLNRLLVIQRKLLEGFRFPKGSIE
jgi:hypothetical protein